jgi:hypothetical protein
MARLPTVGGDAGNWGTILNEYLTVSHNADGTIKIPTGRTATKVVKASNASSSWNNQADYTCDGTGDNVEIQAALDALPAIGGRVVLSEGTFNITAAIQTPRHVSIVGQGRQGTKLVASTSGINIIEMHGTPPNIMDRWNMLTGLVLDGNNLECTGLSLDLADMGHFRNLRIVNVDGYGIRLGPGAWDNHFVNVDILKCGSSTNSQACILFEANSTSSANSNKFYDLRIENFRYRAIQINGYPDAGPSGNPPRANTFIGIKLHGEPATSPTGQADGLYISGCMSLFYGLQITNLGTDYTAITLADAAHSNQIHGVHMTPQVGTFVNIAADANNNIIDGFTVGRIDQYNTSTKRLINGFLIAGHDNVISNGALYSLAGYGATISGDRNKFSNVVMADVDGKGLILTGSDCDIIDVSPHDVSSVSGEAIDVSGDYNRIIGGKCGGDGNKTIVFNAGANNNEVIGARVQKAIVNNGSGNTFRNVQGYVTENKGTATVANGTTSVNVTHGLAVTPAAKDIVVTPTNNLGSATKFWTSSFTTTTFTINVNADPGATTATFAWSCQVL